MKNLKKYTYIVFAIILITSCSSEDDTVNENQEPNVTSITEEILRLVNAHRQSIQLSPLQNNATAEQLSIDHTNYMISISDINHDNFDQRSNALVSQENATGTGENVAKFYPNAQSVVDGWLNSSGHKANIEGNFTHTGIAAIKDSQGRYYYTQLFYR